MCPSITYIHCSYALRFSHLYLPNVWGKCFSMVRMQPPTLPPLSRQKLLRRWQNARLVLLSVAGGLVVGLLAAGLRLVLEILGRAALTITGYAPPGTLGEGGLMMSFGSPQHIGLLLLPALGALYVWLLPRDGEPLNQTVRVGLGKRSDADERWALSSEVQTLGATALASAGGLLVGRDAVFAALGRLGTRVLNFWTRLSPSENRTLVLATTAAGLGAVLHAPLAAAVLVAEVLYRRFEFEYEVLMSCVLAAVTGYAVYGLFFGFQPLFAPPRLQAIAASSFVLGLAVTLAATAAAWLSLRLAERVPKPHHPAEYALAGATFGALTAVLVLLVGPQVLGGGSGWLGLGLSDMLGSQAALAAAGWRWLLLTLGVTLAFGAGILPGAAIGGLLGTGLGGLLGGDPALGALLGAAAFITVTHNIPVAATLLVVAWGGDAVLPAALLATGFAHLLSGEVGQLPAQVASRSKRSDEANAAVLVMAEFNRRTLADQVAGAETERQLYRRAVPSSWGGVAIGQLALPPSMEVLGVIRSGEEIVLPRRSLRLMRDDEVLLLSRPDAYAALDALLELPELR